MKNYNYDDEQYSFSVEEQADIRASLEQMVKDVWIFVGTVVVAFVMAIAIVGFFVGE